MENSSSSEGVIMVLARWQSTITDEAGNIVADASVEVRSETTGALATIYSDRAGTIPISNPTLSDGNGFVGFYVTGDAYKITSTKGETIRQFRYVGIGTASEEDKALITVAESTFSGQANVIFSGLDLYRKVVLEIERLIPGTDDEDLHGFISIDDGVSFLGGALNAYSHNRATQATAALSGSAGTSELLMGEGLGNDTGEFYNSTISFTGHTDGSIYKNIRSSGILYDSAPVLRVADTHGIILTGGSVTDFALQMSAGTMSGKVIFKGEPL